MLRHGLSVRLIAQRRGISVDAIKFHVANVVGKLGLSGLRELRRWKGVAQHSVLHKKGQTMTDASLNLGPIGQISRSLSVSG